MAGQSQHLIPFSERESDNAPGPFYVVKDMCIICGVPPETAPMNISWDDSYQQDGESSCPNHCRIERQPETAEEVEQIIQAAISSCVEAIRYCGTDPRILARFQACGAGSLCDVLCGKSDKQEG